MTDERASLRSDAKPDARRRAPRNGSLTLRLFLTGALQLIIAVLVGDWLITKSMQPQDGERYAVTAAVADEAVAPIVDDPAKLAAFGTRMRENQNIELSVYRADGVKLFTNVEPPLGFPDSRNGPAKLPERTRTARFTRDNQEYVLVLRAPLMPVRRFSPPIINILSGLAIVSLWVIALGRWVVRPLRKLTRAASAFGKGDLKARAGLTRRDELGDLGRTFDEMAVRIENLVLAEKELLANVSHELRTPLARIRVALDLAAEGDAEAARLLLSEMAIDLTELETIIDDILTATRFELAGRSVDPSRAATFPMKTALTTAGAIAQQAEERFRSHHLKRPFNVTVAEDAPNLHVDPSLVRRALDNLLENAHKYSPDDRTPIALSVRKENDTAVFLVEDRGLGIPEEDIPHVFDAFFRSEKSRSRGTGGVGLGLTLAKRIIEASGGAISVTSRTGNESGTTFRVTLPSV